jgi:hypothetical protein
MWDLDLLGLQLKTTDMRKSKGSALTSDASREWEIRSVVGQKIIDHEVYYRVNWEPT